MSQKLGATWPLPLSEISKAVGNISLRQAKLPSLDAIHIDAQLGSVHHLMNVHVGGAGNTRDALGQLLAIS